MTIGIHGSFDPTTWRDLASDTLRAAGAQRVRSLRPASISLTWPVRDDVTIPLEIEHQEGSTLIIVALRVWQPLPTSANKRLVAAIKRRLEGATRADTSFLNVQWQYANDAATWASFSIDDYVHADTGDWLARIVASLTRLTRLFTTLDAFFVDGAADIFRAGAVHVALLALDEQLAARARPAVVAALRAAFPAVTKEDVDVDGVVRAIALEGAPQDALAALDQPLLEHVEEITMYFDDDAVTRFLAAGPLPRQVAHVEIVGLDAQRLDVVAAILARFPACESLALVFDDEERFSAVDVTDDVGVVDLSFAQLARLDVVCDADEDSEREVLDLLLSSSLPRLRRFTLDSRGRREGASTVRAVLAQMPSTVTEVGLWQSPSTWPAAREALLTHEIVARLTAVGVRDDIDELRDARLDGRRLFGQRNNVGNVAHDLNALGRHAEVVAMLAPLLWKADDVDVLAHYASSIAELDPEAGVVAWRAVLARSPQHRIATHNLANQLMAMQRYEDAAPVVVAALGLAPDDPWMLRSLAVIWRARGDEAQAQPYATRFIEAATAEMVEAEAAGTVVHGDVRYVLACAQMWAGLVDVACATLEEAVAADMQGVTPDVDVEWEGVRSDPRWVRLFARA